jgi:phospholipid-binding lipoprotein MlaA
VDPVWNLDHIATRNTLYAGRAVNYRANALDAVRVIEEAALDKYRFVRDSHLQRRRSLIYDGDPPREREPENSSRALPFATQAAAVESGSEPAFSEPDAGVRMAEPALAGATAGLPRSFR